MPLRTFEAQVVDGCLVKTTDQLRTKASAIIRSLVVRMKACGYLAVPFEKGRFRGRCRFHINDSQCEINIQETISRYRADGTQGSFRPTGHLYLRARVDGRSCIYRVNWAGQALEDQLDDILSELGRYTQKKGLRESSRPARKTPTPELDREKIRNAVRGLQDHSVYYMLCDAIDLLPDAELAKLIAPYLHLERLRADSQSKPGLLEDVKTFEAASLAGEYYEQWAAKRLRRVPVEFFEALEQDGTLAR